MMNGLRNFERKDIREQVFEELLGKITTSAWKPGERIPSENELTTAMGVSRISVREAIQKLAAMDLVETFKGKGTFVKEFTTNSYLKSLTPMILLSKEDVKYILEYRKILEVGIIDLYMKKVLKSDIDRLQKNLDKMKQYRNNLNKYKVYDLAFHMKLYEMTRNPFIIKITNMIRDILNSSMGAVLTEKGAEEGIAYHSDLLKYIKEGNMAKLKEVTTELLGQVEYELEEL